MEFTYIIVLAVFSVINLLLVVQYWKQREFNETKKKEVDELYDSAYMTEKIIAFMLTDSPRLKARLMEHLNSEE